MTIESKDSGDSRDSAEEQYTKKEFSLLLYRLKQLPSVSRAKVQGMIAETLLQHTGQIETPAGRLRYVPMGKVAAGRMLSLFTKQPATISWIESFPRDSLLWDIGANVGVYTMYAALRGHRVVAFEPAAVNYFLLAANCEANDLTERVDCLLAGVGEHRGIARFAVSQFDPAASFSVQREDRPRARNHQTAIVTSMDELLDEYGLPCPNYIKIDAPGMSEAIIAGGRRLLQRTEVREVHIELREDSRGGPRIIDLLQQRGFTILTRHQHRGSSSDLTFGRTAVP